jgi:hypothetical protein
MPDLVTLAEPKILFAYDQALEDPRDGLSLFGPLDKGKPYGLRAAVIGTRAGIERFKKWVVKTRHLISNKPANLARPPFPGFESAFRIPWDPNPVLEIAIDDKQIEDCVRIDDKHQRVYKTVDLYSSKIAETITEEEVNFDVWFVVIPDDVHRYCRPKAYVEAELRIEAEFKMSPKAARELRDEPSMFEEDNVGAIPYHYEVDFHNQLKGRLLKHKAPIQIIRESTIAHRDFTDKFGRPIRKLDSQLSAVAWNISTTAFYKAGGRPWKLAGIREGVCYIGLVFKQDDKSPDPSSACCAAQMFLDSGDGIVFKGAVGPWYVQKRGDFHLNRKAAKELVEVALNSYKKRHDKPPKELFIHGRVRFYDEEWKGFEEAVDPSTSLVGVRIRKENNLKLFRKYDHPVLRGMAYIQDEKTAFLWTKGFIPRLQTYPGREVPNPLLIDVCRGEANIETVLNDIMALTKLNYNSCIFADGYPVTLKFAEAVGEILTAGPFEDIPPLPFKYYI